MTEQISHEEKLQIDDRISRTEENVLSLSKSVSSLEKSLENLSTQQSREHDATRAQISELSHTLSQSRAGQWPIVLGILSLILVAMGGFATFVILVTSPLHEDQVKLESMLQARNNEIPAWRQEFGMNTAKIEINWEETQRLKEQMTENIKTDSYVRGRVDAIENNIDVLKDRLNDNCINK